MSDTPMPLTDSLSTFLFTQFPATRGNVELNKRLLEFYKLERELQMERACKSEIYDRANVLERELGEAKRLNATKVIDLIDEITQLRVELKAVLEGHTSREDWSVSFCELQKERDQLRSRLTANEQSIQKVIVRLMAYCGPYDSWKVGGDPENSKPEITMAIVELSNLLPSPFTTEEAVRLGDEVGISLRPTKEEDVDV